MKLNAKEKRGDAERAAEHYAVHIHNCVITQRAVRTKWQAVDFFGADVVGKKADGVHVYIQATAGQYSSVTKRRRKLEVVPWHTTDIVELIQLIQTIDPANARRKLWFFRVHRYSVVVTKGFRTWYTTEKAVPIPKEWFRAYKEGSSNENLPGKIKAV